MDNMRYLRAQTTPTDSVAANVRNGGGSGTGGSGSGDGGNDGGSGDSRDSMQVQPSASSSPSPRRRRKRVSRAEPGNAGDWQVRGIVLRQRTAQWFERTRTQKLRMSLRELQDAAHADGVTLSTSSIQRIEDCVDFEVARERSWIAFDYILWLAAYSGQSLADVDRAITSGDWRYLGALDDAAVSEDSQADRMRAVFLALTPKRRQEAVSFMAFSRSQDDKDLRAALGMRLPPATQAATTPAVTPSATETASNMDAGIDAGTQQVMDELAHGEETLRQELQQHEESQQPGQKSNDKLNDKKRRKDQG